MAEAPGAGVPAASLPAVPGWHGVDEPGEQNEVHLDGGEGADEDEEHGEGEEILLSDIALGRGSTDDEEGEVVDELVHIADECIRARLTEHEEDEEEGDGVDLAELASRQGSSEDEEEGDGVDLAELASRQGSSEDEEEADLLADGLILKGDNESSDEEVHCVHHSWEQWPSFFRDTFNIKAHPADSVKVVSLCSGTDSGAHALVQLLGVDAVNVLWSVDKAPEAFQWARANMRPSHYFEKMDNINEPSARCFICGETTCSEDEEEGETMCSAINELQPDVAIVTLPCTPFSSLNANRWTGDPFEQEAAQPWFEFTRWLQNSPVPPRMVLYENVQGTLKKAQQSNGKAPIEVMMEGVVCAESGEKKCLGFKDLNRYWTLPVLKLRASDLGLPSSRPRVFVVLLLKAHFSSAAAARVLRNLRTLGGMKLTRLPFKAFLATSDSEDELNTRLTRNRKRAQITPPMTLTYKQLSEAFRKQHGLPSRSADSGRPFSRRVTAAMHDTLTDRELDVCDTAYLYCLKFWKDVDLDSIVIDVSDNPNRRPWTDGSKAPTLSTGSKLVHNRKLVGFKTQLQMMGWAGGTYRIPEGLSASTLQRLLGNMLCPPMAGAVLAAVLAVDQDRLP